MQIANLENRAGPGPFCIRLIISYLKKEGIMKQLLILLSLAVLVGGCATIDHTANIEQPINRQTIVGVGDVVLRVNKQRNLENAFGKADIFGRKTNEGFSELRFAGVEKTGEVVLYRKDVQIVTNETTMSRTPLSTTTGSSNSTISGNYQAAGNVGTVNANARNNYSSTALSPTSDFHVVVPAETIPIRLAVGETKVPMEGYIVEIINAAPNSLEYKITKY